MLKLLKYEFRKALVSFLTLIGITAAAEVYFLVSVHSHNENHTAVSILLLLMLAFATALFVFIRGVVSYSDELRSKSSYLLFLTPTTANQIMASKYLYTFVNGLLLLVLYGVLGFFDIGLAAVEYGEFSTLYALVREMLSQYGVYIDSMVIGALFIVLYGFFELLSMVGIAYFSITLSHTLLRDKKFRWLVSVVFFLIFARLVVYICSLFPSMLDALVMVDMLGFETATEEAMAAATPQVLVSYLLPTFLVNAAVVIATLFASAGMLKRKVSL